LRIVSGYPKIMPTQPGLPPHRVGLMEGRPGRLSAVIPIENSDFRAALGLAATLVMPPSAMNTVCILLPLLMSFCRIVMSSIKRRRSGLMASAGMGCSWSQG
jgi:hypothetical protein